MTTKGKTLSTTRHSFALVSAIQDLGSATLSELAEASDLGKSTVHYHLNTLEDMGYVVEEDGRYALGLRFMEHSMAAKGRKPEYELSKVTSRKLAEETDKEADFSVLENGRLYVLFHDLGDPERVGFQAGNRLHPTNTSAGQAILAARSRAAVDRFIDEVGFAANTDDSITSREEFHAKLDRVREQGYAVNDGEWVEGFVGISMCAQYPDGTPFGSLSLSGPKYKLSPAELERRYSGRLAEYVTDLESKLASLSEQPDDGGV